MSLAQKFQDFKLKSGRAVRIWALAWSNPVPQQTYAVEIGGEGPQRERVNGDWRRVKSLQELKEENEVLEKEIAMYQLGEGGWYDDDDEDGWRIRKKRKERSRSRSRSNKKK